MATMDNRRGGAQGFRFAGPERTPGTQEYMDRNVKEALAERDRLRSEYDKWSSSIGRVADTPVSERRRMREELKKAERRARQKQALQEFGENVSDFRDYIGASVYNPRDVAAAGGLDPRIMAMMERSRGIAGDPRVAAQREAMDAARARALQARNAMQGAVNMYMPFATGEQSVSRQQADLDADRARAQILSNLAGQGRGMGAAGFMAAQRGIADQNAAISQQAQLNAARERLAAIGALQQGLGGLAGLDQAQQQFAAQQMGQEGQLQAQAENQAAQLMQLAMQEQARQAQFDYAKEQGKQARDTALVNAAMGQYGQERAIDMAKMADEAARKQRQNQGILSAIQSFVPLAGG